MSASLFCRPVRRRLHRAYRRSAVSLAAVVLALSSVSNAFAADTNTGAPGTPFEIVVGESQLDGSGALEPRLLDAVAKWVSREFDLPAPAEPPRVLQVSVETMIGVRYSAFGIDEPPGPLARNARSVGHEILALYDDRKKAIYLSDRWSGRTPNEISVLVHEMVHHLQNLAGLSHACPAEREKLAYRAQARFLSLFGKTLESEFSIDPMTLLLRTSCMM